MLSRLASYLMGSGAGADDDASGTGSAEHIGPDEPNPVEARLRQVEVEGDDWILIDRNVEGAAGLDESWYVTPPACFTQPGPVHVETSPLEDLLIEHPSMSVYRAAGSKALGDKHEPKKRPSAVAKALRGSQQAQEPQPRRLPFAVRDSNLQAAPTLPGQRQPKPSAAQAPVAAAAPRQPHHHTHHAHHQHQQQLGEQPRRSSIRDLRNARGDENVRIVQIRSAQKMLEKRSTQSAKRNRLERSNKVREVASGKGRRPRRQDRLRLNNSGANNNRKC